MNNDQSIFVNLLAMDIVSLNRAMEELGFSSIKGLDNLTNAIRKGRPLEKMKERFYGNLLKVCKEYVPDNPRYNLGKFPDVMERTLERARYYSDMLKPEDPIQYHSKHLNLIDSQQVYNYMADQTVASKRIFELLKLGRPELALPALKDQFVLVFEKMYKGVFEQIKGLFKGFINGDNEPHRLAEDILALEKTYGSDRGFRSDLRCLRNAFAHPDRIDRYDHYSVDLFGEETQDLDAEELEIVTVLMTLKTAILMFLIRITVEFRLYSIIFENQK